MMTEYNIKEILRFHNGRGYDSISEHGSIPVYGSGGVMGYTNKSLLEGEYILLPRKGSLNNYFYINKPFWNVDTIYAADVMRDDIDCKYLYYYFKCLNLGNLDSGSTLPSMTQSAYGSIKVKLPSRDTQKTVAKFLTTIDDKISVNNKIIETSEKLMHEIYDYWFVQFDFPDENGRPYKSSGGTMVYNETLKREIPKGWEVESLVNCVSKEKNAIVDGPFGTQMKIGDYVESGVPIYEMDQLNGAFITKENKHFITEQKYEEVKRSTVKNGDIIISKTGTLGLLGLVRSKYSKGIIVSRLAKITPNPNIIGKYALLIYLSKLTKNGYWLNMCGGSTMPILNNSIISRTKIIVPNSDLYQRFETVASPIYEQIYNLQLETQKLISLRDWLLPMLMNGQVRIEDK